MAPIKLVRHGRYDRKKGSPTEGKLVDAGREQAARARDALLEAGLGAGAIVLSSNAERARETADIIGQGLGARAVVYSRRIELGGEHTNGIRDLDAFLKRSLEESAVMPYDVTEGLVVVSHAPLLIAAKALTEAPDLNVDYGEIVSYEPGTWTNPLFSPEMEGYINTRIW